MKNLFAYSENAARQSYQWLAVLYKQGGEASKGFIHGSYMGISLLANGAFRKMDQACSASVQAGFTCKVTGIMQIAATVLTVYFAFRMLNDLKALYNPEITNRLPLANGKLSLCQQEIAALSHMLQNVQNGTLDLSPQDRFNLCHSLVRLRNEEKNLSATIA